jgi:hypothetical protein
MFGKKLMLGALDLARKSNELVLAVAKVAASESSDSLSKNEMAATRNSPSRSAVGDERLSTEDCQF